MKSVKKSAALAAVLALGAVAVSAQSAAAYVACNGADCWHSDHRYKAPGVSLNWHPDDWYFHHGWDKDHWRGHQEGRGYYRNGVWIHL